MRRIKDPVKDTEILAVIAPLSLIRGCQRHAKGCPCIPLVPTKIPVYIIYEGLHTNPGAMMNLNPFNGYKDQRHDDQIGKPRRIILVIELIKIELIDHDEQDTAPRVADMETMAYRYSGCPYYGAERN